MASDRNCRSCTTSPARSTPLSDGLVHDLLIISSRSMLSRQVLSVIICVAYQRSTDPSKTAALFDRFNVYAYARGLAGISSAASHYSALNYFTLSEVLTVFQLRLFLVAGLCLLVLGEKFGRVQVLACGGSHDSSELTTPKSFLSELRFSYCSPTGLYLINFQPMMVSVPIAPF
jgi:uncharacterized membrane protein